MKENYVANNNMSNGNFWVGASGEQIFSCDTMLAQYWHTKGMVSSPRELEAMRPQYMSVRQLPLSLTCHMYNIMLKDIAI